MMINLYAVPLIIGFVMAWVCAAIIGVRGIRTGRYSDRIFGTLLIAVSILLLPYMLGYMGVNILWNELLFFPRDPLFLIGPLFYFYFKAQINTRFRIKLRQYWHFIPFLVHSLFHLLIFFQGRDFIIEWSQDHPHFENIFLLFGFISMVCYFVLTLKTYNSYKKWLANEMPEGTSFTFRWFNHVLIAILVAMLVIWSFTLVNILGFPLDYNHNVWQHICLSVIIVFLSLEGYAQKQPLYLDFIQDESPAVELLSSTNVEPETCDETENSHSEIAQKIQELMSHKKVFLNSELSLSSFARELGYSRSEVSYVINNNFEKNFSQFVNHYRVEEVCSALEKGEHERYSLLGIAMNAGFNSKATFNRVFKENKQVTPLQYAEKYVK